MDSGLGYEEWLRDLAFDCYNPEFPCSEKKMRKFDCERNLLEIGQFFQLTLRFFR
jgi:hypothetical protein